MKNYKTTPLLIFALAMSIFTQSCMVPSFSEIQSARMPVKKSVDLTPFYTAIPSLSTGSGAPIGQQHLGLQSVFGISDKFALCARMEYVSTKTYFESSSWEPWFSSSLGPKFALKPRYVAMHLPLCFDFMDGEVGVSLKPTLILTYPGKNKHLDASLCLKAIIYGFSPDAMMFATNFNLAIGKNVESFAVRPEAGLLVMPGGSGPIYQFSIGITKNFKSKKNSN